MKTTLQELEARRKGLINYSDVQRVRMAESATVLRRPVFQADRLADVLKTHPLAAGLGVAGILVASLMARRFAKVSFGLWLGKQAWRLLRLFPLRG